MSTEVEGKQFHLVLNVIRGPSSYYPSSNSAFLRRIMVAGHDLRQILTNERVLGCMSRSLSDRLRDLLVPSNKAGLGDAGKGGVRFRL
jgi:hypothetical protein